MQIPRFTRDDSHVKKCRSRSARDDNRVIELVSDKFLERYSFRSAMATPSRSGMMVVKKSLEP